MPHFLVALLGARLSEANYVFQEDGGEIIRTRYCALAIFDHLKNLFRQPDRLIILGTPGSCWGDLVEVLHEHFGRSKDEKPQMAALREKTEDGHGECPLTQEDLEPWKDWINAHAAPPGTHIEFRLIDYASTPGEQRAFIHTLDALVTGARRLTFDLTHSLRHLATLALLAAMIIRKHRGIDTSIHYGAFEISHQNNGLSPVIRLDGLLDMLDFLAALSAYDKDGDYAVFAPLFEVQGAEEQAMQLREASFREYAGDFTGAVEIIRELRKAPLALANEWRLIGDELNERFAWVDNPDLYGRQRGRAFKALEQGDLMRAAVWGTEAVITRVMMLGGENPADRNRRSRLGSNRRPWPQMFADVGLDKNHLEAFLLLNRMRHQFAHAGLARLDDKIEKAMTTRENCIITLKSVYDTLLPENPSLGD